MEALDAYRTQTRYNTWFNSKLYAVSAALTDEERRRELGSFFGSVHRTLNHLIVCDHIWLTRCAPHLAGAQPRDAAGNLVKPAGLEVILYDDFALLRERRTQLDGTIEEWAASMQGADLDADVVYRNMKGDEFRHPLWWVLTHLFNHQTHHRGQVTTMMFQLGHDPGVTDLLAMLRQ